MKENRREGLTALISTLSFNSVSFYAYKNTDDILFLPPMQPPLILLSSISGKIT